MTKPFHAGHAARNGVFAAMLAREGLTASDTALEGRQGYAAAFSPDDAGRRTPSTGSGSAGSCWPPASR